jgi:hypothetical protein
VPIPFHGHTFQDQDLLSGENVKISLYMLYINSFLDICSATIVVVGMMDFSEVHLNGYPKRATVMQAGIATCFKPVLKWW